MTTNENIKELEIFMKKNYPKNDNKIEWVLETYKKLVETLRSPDEGDNYKPFALKIGLISHPDEWNDRVNNRLKILLGMVSHFTTHKFGVMLSAIICKNEEPYTPGDGFFKFAEELGYDFDDDYDFWGEQMKTLRKMKKIF